MLPVGNRQGGGARCGTLRATLGNGGKTKRQSLVPTERYSRDDRSIDVIELYPQGLPILVEGHGVCTEVKKNSHTVSLFEQVVSPSDGPQEEAAGGELLGCAAGQPPGPVANGTGLDSDDAVGAAPAVVKGAVDDADHDLARDRGRAVALEDDLPVVLAVREDDVCAHADPGGVLTDAHGVAVATDTGFRVFEVCIPEEA